MARRVVDLRSRLEDAARRFPGGGVRAQGESRTDAPADTAAPETGKSGTDDPVEEQASEGGESRTDAPAETAAPAVEENSYAGGTATGNAPGMDQRSARGTDERGAGETGDSFVVPPAPKAPKRSRQRAARKRGQAAVTKASAARMRGAMVPRGAKQTKVGRPGRAAASRDPFSERLRSLEREIEDALREGGGDGPGTSGVLQRAGEQLLGFYADLARALVEGGVEAAFVRLRMIGTADAVDEFGFDTTFYERVEPLLRFLHDRWWRVETTGLRHVPRTGRVMCVANHSGGLMPYDGLMIAHALGARRAGRGRAAHPLIEDGAYHFPFAGSTLARLGVVRASAANAERLLGRDRAILVFPEGAKGSCKYYQDRYRLQRFARGGFVSLALRTGTPLVPVAVVGAEEIYPVLLRWQWLARILGVPEFPVTPTFPWLGILGLIPLPTKWRLVFGAPIDLVAEYGADAYDDELLVNRLKELVRERVQRMLIDALRDRDSVFSG